ncbi:uncharacterized protein I206_100468 [Kwoniella pini CBS 10737]|uniref:Uncharacterized protein n=1 Tax=Kwoniella pini CBS 10737 TaxID=1296096 RepID=A0A1B9IDD5_9TREE|nr:uncharacterized protein I206_00861 [Kwoniella pini CBS 10737]OCF53556.1 hypothetical protein I206_00861 [Kwoniella pini CBS 10737]
MKRSPSTSPESETIIITKKNTMESYQFVPYELPHKQNNIKDFAVKFETNKTPPKKRVKNKESSPISPTNGEWTADKRKQFMDEIIALGYKAANLDQIAQRLDLNKRQLINQLTTIKGNFRSKAVAAVKKG